MNDLLEHMKKAIDRAQAAMTLPPKPQKLRPDNCKLLQSEIELDNGHAMLVVNWYIEDVSFDHAHGTRHDYAPIVESFELCAFVEGETYEITDLLSSRVHALYQTQCEQYVAEHLQDHLDEREG